MTGREELRIPKRPLTVTLWVHPEGPVVGCLFLAESGETGTLEDPLEVLNGPAPFIVVRREGAPADPIRFYNKRAIVRVLCGPDEEEAWAATAAQACELHLMDGTVLRGTVRHSLPPERARLYDFFNLERERFARIRLEDGEACLVNKAYVVAVIPRDEG
ncbi:hypothetical protein [Inmirania thermothiophila]|uniref:Uncharacterized protein n=1 Tax=Inmirania thermothiophila TaxID=1750597 RepID=A0A3N1Y008_9GAMM|nr:hypothetical protein [Inmirania thermothiophila]ROR32159.1 hypothetical protein EDC57_1350 [Inmirania thermothiophila]